MHLPCATYSTLSSASKFDVIGVQNEILIREVVYREIAQFSSYRVFCWICCRFDEVTIVIFDKPGIWPHFRNSGRIVQLSSMEFGFANCSN
jgi:hypothetical protein